MWTGPGPPTPGPKLGGGGGGWEYTGATGGCEYSGGAVGAFWPGKVLKGGCISDCCELVAPFSRKLVTSALVTLPWAPEPGTLLRSSPCSWATLRPTGVARMPFASAELDSAAGVGPALAACCPVDADVDVGVDVSVDGDGDVAVDAAPPASSTRASAPPTVTTAPSFASCSTSTPAAGE